MDEADHANAGQHHGPTLSDTLFLAFLVFALAGVAWAGRLSYVEGMKTETTKRNGEAWAKWLSETSAERGKEGYAPSACAAGAVLADKSGFSNPEPVELGEGAVPAAASNGGPRTWGDCLSAMASQGGPLTELRNPFFRKPLATVAKCDRADRSLAGAMVLEKLMPTPPGSSVPFTASQLVESDSIAQKMAIRITLCDGGAYPIRIAEVEF